MWRWLAEAMAVAAKDLRTEFRTRVAINSLGLFALTVLAAVWALVGLWALIRQLRRPSRPRVDQNVGG